MEVPLVLARRLPVLVAGVRLVMLLPPARVA